MIKELTEIRNEMLKGVKEKDFLYIKMQINKIDTLLYNKSKNNVVLSDVSNSLAVDDYEPYFGWCDVDGCENEGCSGGNAWRKTGYWTVCYKHADDFRKGLEQPKMKQTAIKRENKRNKKTGYLSQ